MSLEATPDMISEDRTGLQLINTDKNDEPGVLARHKGMRGVTLSSLAIINFIRDHPVYWFDDIDFAYNRDPWSQVKFIKAAKDGIYVDVGIRSGKRTLIGTKRAFVHVGDLEAFRNSHKQMVNA